MHQSHADHGPLHIECLAHQDARQRLLLVRIKVADLPAAAEPQPLQLALAIDRSGSMRGEKLEVAADGAAQVVRSLEPSDRIAVVAFDDKVDLVAPLGPPSTEVEQRTMRLVPGGSTALYDGWLAAAKQLGPGGRVLLLSDGQANRGRFFEAESLGLQARTTLRRFGISTSTIGIGQGYDERLMAAMASEGAGATYYCREPKEILEAFARERDLATTIVAEFATLSCGGREENLGFLVEGETRTVAFAIGGLGDAPPVLRFRQRGAADTVALELPLPADYGDIPEATALILAQSVAEQLERASAVRSSEDAKAALEGSRALLLRMLEHPDADTPRLRPGIDKLKASIARLDQLAQHWDEDDGNDFRKEYRMRRMAASPMRELHLSESFCREPDMEMLRMSAFPDFELKVDPAAFQLAPPEEWIAALAAPISVEGNIVKVVASSRGPIGWAREFGAKHGVRVTVHPARHTRGEIVKAIKAAARDQK